MASPVYLWYTSEVFFWRSLASTCWAIICLPFLVFLYLLFSSISMTHPVAWITDSILSIISLKFMFAVSVFGMSVVLVTWFSLPYFSVKPRIDSSKLASIVSLFHWSRLTLLTICMLNGVLAGWSLSFLAGIEFDSLSFISKHDGRDINVLNERHLFLVGCGFFTGFCHFYLFFSQRKYHLTFPNIQRLKLFQARSELSSLIYSTFWQTLHIMKYFYILYFLFGGLPRFWIDNFFGLALDYSTVPLDSIYGLLDVSLAWHFFLTSYLITFAWSMSLKLTRIFHTEHMEFPIISLLEDMRGKTLADALACVSSPLLQHLAFLDLAWLTKFSSSRVQELFSLSQPGGHPKIWAAICEIVLSVIWRLTSSIQNANLSILSKVSVNPHQNGVQHNKTHGNMETTADSSLHFRGQEASTNGKQEREREKPQKRSIIPKWFQISSRIPVFSHLLTESPDTNSQHLFSECQLQIWAVESLSHVAVRAYTEDKYGVVQSSLPAIFSCLLDLNESMEKHFKLTSVTSRRQSSSEIPSDVLLRHKLHSVLKSSLYRLVNTYRSHLPDLYLSHEEMKKLNPFIDYTA